MTERTVQEFDAAALAELLREHFGLAAERLCPTVSFDELGLDSLGLMELVVALEDRTGAELGDRVADLTPEATLDEAARVIDAALRGE
ncbi:acyl carrier protein [Streptomyces sp. M19]